MIVLDASAVVELLVNGPGGGQVADEMRRAGSLHAPQLLTAEVAQVSRRLTLAGAMSVERGEQVLTDLADLPIELYDHRPFLGRVWELRDAVTAYDALYLALAEALDAPLLTLDARLARAPGADAVTRVVAP